MYRIVTTPEFDADLKKLDRDVARRIVKKLEWASHHSETLRFPLRHAPKDLKGIQKYRVGDHRVLLWVDRKERQIIPYGVEHRRSVYDDL